MSIKIGQKKALIDNFNRLFLSCLLAMLMFKHSAIAADNVRFYGVLSAQPCDISLDDKNILVDMQSIVNKVLYSKRRTPGSLFHINLKQCTPELAKTVNVTFKALESDELHGFMAIPSSHGATGITIGLELLDGSRVPFNHATTVHSITHGDNQIRLRAFVQAEPSAIAAKSIALGAFQAYSTFFLAYE